MGDVQQYYIDHGVRNHYSVSISGYHIAEAGANPITQLAFTLVLRMLSTTGQGHGREQICPKSFIFLFKWFGPGIYRNWGGARRIWAIAMRNLYDGDAFSKLKYHRL